MPIKKKSKVSAEFSMSSLTDIIFLLLIFFMLTSSSVMPNALNLKLPGRSAHASSNHSRPARVDVSRSGTYYLNGQKITFASLDKTMRKYKKKKGKKASIVLAANPKAKTEDVVAVMDMTYRYHIDANLVEGKK